MGLVIGNGTGDTIDEPSLDDIRRILSELDPDDVEHGVAYGEDDDGRVLEFEVDGNLSFFSDGEVRHIRDATVDLMIELCLALARGDIASLELQPWRPGARPPMSPEDRSRYDQRLAEHLLAYDREFYDLLGPERPDVPCRHLDCDRGAVRFSAFCRTHHFANVRGRPCPFDDSTGC